MSTPRLKHRPHENGRRVSGCPRAPSRGLCRPATRGSSTGTDRSESQLHQSCNRSVQRLGLGILLVVASAVSLAASAAAADTRPSLLLEVSAGDFDREHTPVLFSLPPSLASCPHLRLTRKQDDRPIPAQRMAGEPPTLAWLVADPLPAGQQRQYLLTAADAAGDAPEVMAECRDDGRHLWLQLGDRKVLRYNHAVQESPEGMDPCYRRSGYIHPLYTPSGKEVTGDFAPDHAHQHGVFMAWVNTTFQGQEVDFWNQKKGSGLIEHVDIRSVASGPVFAEFTVGLRHRALTTPEAAETVLEETWTVRAWNVPDVQLVDLESRQRCVAEQPLTINEYHYGGMAIRGNSAWLDAETTELVNRLMKAGASRKELAAAPVKRAYLTSEGKLWFDGNGTRARWVEMSGPIDGQPAGVAIFGHPENFRAPQPVRLHPQKPYFCFAPMVLGEFPLQSGETYVSRYRYCVHDGPVSVQRNEHVWSDMASPPAVRIVSKD